MVCVLALAFAAMSCGVLKNASAPASPSALADPGSQRLAMQQRPVLGIVYFGSPAWRHTALTCAPRDDKLAQCIAETLDSHRIVLVASRPPDKYILGPVVVDGSDVLQAAAVPTQVLGLGRTWDVNFRLTPEGAKRFAEETRAAVGRQLAIIVDGEVVSAPTVMSPIVNGTGVITGAFNQERAKALASQLNGSA